MFETILVPVDGSDSSWQALDEAVEIAKREAGEAVLHGLYVVDAVLLATLYGYPAAETGVPYETLATEETELAEQGRAVLEEFAKRVATAGVRFETELAKGEVGAVISERAGLADLVVLGRHGAGGAVSRLLFGSTFEAVVRYSPRPVLVAVDQPRPVRRVLVAYDGSDRAKDALKVVAGAGWVQGAEVIVLSVVEPGRVGHETLDAAVAYLREHNIEPALLLLPEEHPAAAILRVAAQRDVDLIALGGYGHGRFLEVFFGHTVNEVLRGTTRPVLVCR